MSEPYSKHKDRDPKDTVDGIVDMLEQVGLDTEVRWTSHPFEGLCSNRVTIAGTNIGTNGKSTSEEYCLASGYAEFMERLQNNILGSTALTGAQIFERRGFLAAPDERHVTPDEIEARRDPVLEGWLATLGVRTHRSAWLFLRGCCASTTLVAASRPWRSPTTDGDRPCAIRSHCPFRLRTKMVRRTSSAPPAGPIASS